MTDNICMKTIYHIIIMQKKKLKTFGLTLIAFALTLSAAQAANALLVHPANGGAAAKFDLNNVQRITFSNGEMLVKPFGSNAAVFVIENISKISFEEMDVAINRPVITPEVIVYISPAGEVVVKSEAGVKSLTLFSTEGRILQKTDSSTMFIGSLTANVYLLQIETTKGIVVKKIIKQ